MWRETSLGIMKVYVGGREQDGEKKERDGINDELWY